MHCLESFRQHPIEVPSDNRVILEYQSRPIFRDARLPEPKVRESRAQRAWRIALRSRSENLGETWVVVSERRSVDGLEMLDGEINATVVAAETL